MRKRKRVSVADPQCRHWWRRRGAVQLTARVKTQRVFCRRCIKFYWPHLNQAYLTRSQ